MVNVLKWKNYASGDKYVVVFKETIKKKMPSNHIPQGIVELKKKMAKNVDFFHIFKRKALRY